MQFYITHTVTTHDDLSFRKYIYWFIYYMTIRPFISVHKEMYCKEAGGRFLYCVCPWAYLPMVLVKLGQILHDLLPDRLSFYKGDKPGFS
jgi:hypothetical protein